MSKNPGQSHFRRGAASLIVLSLLDQEDMYGYQLVQETERQTGGRIITQEGSLYPVLYKLQSSGYISDRRVLVGKRMTRIYYHLEPAGKEYLKYLIEDYHTVMSGILQLLDKGGEQDA